MGGFECGLRFNDGAGGACESVCIAVVVILGYPARVVGLGHPVLDSTSSFFNSISGPLFNLLCPLTNFFFGLALHCGCVMRCFVEDWCGGRFSGYGGHWDIGEWCGVRDEHRELVG